MSASALTTRTTSALISLADIEAARVRIAPFVRRTPVLTSDLLDEAAGAQLFFKCENLQHIGAFKARGATNAVLSLSDAALVHHVRPSADLLFSALAALADSVRRDTVGDDVTYVVTRNINFTNVCYTGCRFCAFAQRRTDADAYTLSLEQVGDRAAEAWQAGATEVCMQGGIHPDLPGTAYFDIAAEVKRRCPDLHVHAFSPMEVVNGAARTGLPRKQGFDHFFGLVLHRVERLGGVVLAAKLKAIHRFPSHETVLRIWWPVIIRQGSSTPVNSRFQIPDSKQHHLLGQGGNPEC